jgi:putative membrane protein
MTTKQLIKASIGLSAVLIAALFYLIYGLEGVVSVQGDYSWLSGLNALLNSVSTVFLILGWIFIIKGYTKSHIASMATALVSSALFLVSYIIYHSIVGDTVYTGEGAIRVLYFSVLISHVVLTFVGLPLILLTVSAALLTRFEMHKKWARFALPIWLYVSVTGVVIYLMLKAAS